MKRAVLRVVTEALCAALEAKLPPSGRPHLSAFRAVAREVVDALAEGGAPGLPDRAAGLDADGLAAAFEWLFAAVCRAYPGEPWPQLALHSLRLLALGSAPEVLGVLAQPPSHAQLPALPPKT